MARWSEARGLPVEKRADRSGVTMIRESKRNKGGTAREDYARGCVLEREGTTFSTAYKSNCDEGL